MPVSLDYAAYDLGGMTSADAGEAIPDAEFVVLPTGSIEQHAEHLPVSVDTLRAEALTRELVEAAPDHDLSMVRLPTLPSTVGRTCSCIVAPTDRRRRTGAYVRQ